METNETFCTTLTDILNKTPAFAQDAVAELEQQHDRYDTLLTEIVTANAAMKKFVTPSYDIGLNIKRAKAEKDAKKQKYWYDRAADDFKVQIKALKTDLDCPVSLSMHIKL